LNLANTSGVQTIGAALRDNGGAATLTRSGVGGTTILVGASNLSTAVTISGGTLLVNNPTTNILSLASVTTTNGSRTVTTSESTAGLVVGQTVTAPGVGSGGFITSIVDSTTFTLSSTANASAGTGSATFSPNSGTGNGSVNVTGGTLGGSGLIAPGGTNRITVSSGAFLAPGGNSTGPTIGTLVINGSGTSGAVLTMNSGAKFNFDLGAGNTSDKVNFWNYTAGDFAINSNAVNFTLDAGVTSGTHTFNLFNFYTDSGTTLSGATFSGLAFGTLSSNMESYSFDYTTPGQINLLVTAVPEPSTWALVIFSLTMVICLSRRRIS